MVTGCGSCAAGAVRRGQASGANGSAARTGWVRVPSGAGRGGDGMPTHPQRRTSVTSGRLTGAQLAMTMDLQLGVLLAAELVPGGFCPEIVSRADLTSEPSNPASRVFPGTGDQL